MEEKENEEEENEKKKKEDRSETVQNLNFKIKYPS